MKRTLVQWLAITLTVAATLGCSEDPVQSSDAAGERDQFLGYYLYSKNIGGSELIAMITYDEGQYWFADSVVNSASPQALVVVENGLQLSGTDTVLKLSMDEQQLRWDGIYGNRVDGDTVDAWYDAYDSY
uniref:hypothetical protein n=1 Tax=Thaumasiovibrio occultus TaxID=1891184 RepID=UPI000B35919F|nr:hypothetical protein [Thaumasiovibrio occultus]